MNKEFKDREPAFDFVPKTELARVLNRRDKRSVFRLACEGALTRLRSDEAIKQVVPPDEKGRHTGMWMNAAKALGLEIRTIHTEGYLYIWLAEGRTLHQWREGLVAANNRRPVQLGTADRIAARHGADYPEDEEDE